MKYWYVPPKGAGWRTKMAIYDYDIKDILKYDGCTSSDIEKHIKNGATVFSVEDYIKYLKDNQLLEDILDDEETTEEEYINLLKDGRYNGNGISCGKYENLWYVIEYTL